MSLHPEKPCRCAAEPVWVQVMGFGDVCLWFTCKTCGQSWHRWPEGHYYRRMAERACAEAGA